jgi:hypothetical protein
MDTNVFNGIFWSFFITSTIGCILKLVSMGYKSKCKEFDIGCIKVIRDVDGEEKLDTIELKNELRKKTSY